MDASEKDRLLEEAWLLAQASPWGSATKYYIRRIFTDATIYKLTIFNIPFSIHTCCIIMDSSWKPGARVGTKRLQMKPVTALARTFLPPEEHDMFPKKISSLPRIKTCPFPDCINPFHIDTSARFESRVHKRMNKRRRLNTQDTTEVDTEEHESTEHSDAAPDENSRPGSEASAASPPMHNGYD